MDKPESVKTEADIDKLPVPETIKDHLRAQWFPKVETAAAAPTGPGDVSDKAAAGTWAGLTPLALLTPPGAAALGGMTAGTWLGGKVAPRTDVLKVAKPVSAAAEEPVAEAVEMGMRPNLPTGEGRAGSPLAYPPGQEPPTAMGPARGTGAPVARGEPISAAKARLIPGEPSVAPEGVSAGPSPKDMERAARKADAVAYMTRSFAEAGDDPLPHLPAVSPLEAHALKANHPAEYDWLVGAMKKAAQPALGPEAGGSALGAVVGEPLKGGYPPPSVAAASGESAIHAATSEGAIPISHSVGGPVTPGGSAMAKRFHPLVEPAAAFYDYPPGAEPQVTVGPITQVKPEPSIEVGPSEWEKPEGSMQLTPGDFDKMSPAKRRRWIEILTNKVMREEAAKHTVREMMSPKSLGSYQEKDEKAPPEKMPSANTLKAKIKGYGKPKGYPEV